MAVIRQVSRRVAILGGGNGAHTLAADLRMRGYTVHLFEMETFRHQIEGLFASRTIRVVGDIFSGVALIDKVTDSIGEALDGAEVVFVVVPAFAHADYARLLAPELREDQLVVLLPGTLGTLQFAQTWRAMGLNKNVMLAESDTLPYNTRLEGPGTVRVYARTKVSVGVFPSRQTTTAMQTLEGILDCVPARDVLEVGLSNLNPVIHTPATLLNAGRIERSRGEFFIYEEGITPSVARVLDRLDDERRSLAGAFDLRLLKLADALHAGGNAPRGSTWEALNGSSGLTPIKGPTSLSSRYLTEDVPFGLMAWTALAARVGVATPIMDSVMTLSAALLGRDWGEEGRTAEGLGLDGLNRDQILTYVSEGMRPLS